MPLGLPGGLLGYIKQAIQAGISANRFQKSIVGTPLGVSRTTLLRAFGEVRNMLGRTGALAGHPGDVPVPRDLIFTPPGWSTTDFIHQVEVMVRPIGERETQTRFISVVSDHPLTPDEAVAAGVDIAEGGVENGSFEEVVMGGFLTGVYGTL